MVHGIPSRTLRPVPVRRPSDIVTWSARLSPDAVAELPDDDRPLRDGRARARCATTGADRPTRAAGTVSLLDTPVTGTLLGVQVLAGVDYAVGERTSMGLTAHWARFGELTEDVVWSIIRSHAPVRADGVTPFSGELTFDSVAYWAVTLGLKYHF